MADAGNVVSLAENLLSLGSEVRQLRKARQMTLKDLSRASGISLSHLSAIERGASNPSMDMLERLSAALTVSPDWFFARRPGEGPMERAYVVRSQNRRNLNALYGQDASELGYADSLLSSSVGGEFYMGLAVYKPNSETPSNRLQRHDGEQHGLVIEGELEIQIAEEVITLREGDSYSFDARIPHHARNRTDRICKLIWAVSPVVIPNELANAGDMQSSAREKQQR